MFVTLISARSIPYLSAARMHRSLTRSMKWKSVAGSLFAQVTLLFAVGPVAAQEWSEVLVPAPDGVSVGAAFGTSVSLEQDLLLVGAPMTDDGAPASGAAYLYDRYEGGENAWGFVKKLSPPSPAAEANFGHRVHLTADRAFVSAPGDLNLGVATGAIYVYDRDLGGAGNWGFRQKIVIDTLRSGLRSGSTFLLSDSLLFVDCPGYDENPSDGSIGFGGLAAFRMDAFGVFRPMRFVKGADLAPDLANRPSLSGWLAVFHGALVYTSKSRKAYTIPVEPFNSADATLAEPQRLLLTDTFGLQSIYLYDFGVVANDEHLLMDVHHDDPSIPFQVVSFIGDGSGGVLQTGRMRPDTNALPIEWWGWGEALALYGDRVVVGAFGHAFFTPLGHAEVFDLDPNAFSGWSRVAYLSPSDPHYGDQFGRAASLSEEVVVIGAPGYGELDKGQVYVFSDPNVGLEESPPLSNIPFAVGPNPVRRDQGMVQVILGDQGATGMLLLHGIDGRSVGTLRITGRAIIDVHDLPPAAYLITWIPGDAGDATRSTRIVILP